MGLALAGCATPQTTALLHGSDAERPRRVALDVPFFPQTRDHCGPASVAMVLSASGDSADPRSLADWTFTPDAGGSFQHDLVSALQRRGRLAYPVATLDELAGELAAGRPVLVFQNLRFGLWPLWHYAVATGYDLDRGTLTLHTGGEPDREVTLALFERTWSRAGHWAQVVLEPGALPARPSERTYLVAGVGLERAGRHAAAERAYEAAVARWPASDTAWVALANARLAQGELDGAESALDEALRVQPKSGAAWNNLAHVRLARGDAAGARAAVERAIALGGPLLPSFLRTRDEIEKATP